MEEEKLREILKLIREVQSTLSNIEVKIQSILGGEIKPTVPEWAVQRVKLWQEILKKGGIVTRDELHMIAKKIGIDTRALGGFFTGRDPSLVWLSDGKIGLTERAKRKMKEWGIIGEEE